MLPIGFRVRAISPSDLRAFAFFQAAGDPFGRKAAAEFAVAMGTCNSCAADTDANQLILDTSKMPEKAVPIDPLLNLGDCIFDDKAMTELLPRDVMASMFQDSLGGYERRPPGPVTGGFHLREHPRQEQGSGGGAVGGMLGAFKQDTLMDLEFSSKFKTKPMKACLPAERLFQGETDGSSFPNGGLRVTHSAAAFTTWDRASPPFVTNKTLYIPCAFITHFGKCIDEKTPLLRSMDAVKTHGLRLLKATGLGKDAQTIHSYLGWEQEFFVVNAELFKGRPDLVNTGRTLFGRLPTRHQQGDLNYFQPIPGNVQLLLDRVQALMIKVGCPMAVKHNEVAPGQHEMSPVFRAANVSCDSNVLFMEMMNREAAKLGLQVLFHEKPFAGINGSGKHANWSVGTDTGLNFFYPGKTEEGAKLFVTGIACLSYGLAQYNELVRCTVASAGNDHRLGAQEAPPAIISLYPGQVLFHEKPFAGINGSGKHANWSVGTDTGLNFFYPGKTEAGWNSKSTPPAGSESHGALPILRQPPIMVCNAIMAAGMAQLADLIEGGLSHRDAVAKMFKENKHVIFTGNGYSEEWKTEGCLKAVETLSDNWLTEEISAMRVRILNLVRLFEEIEEGFLHQLPPHDFNLRWELVSFDLKKTETLPNKKYAPPRYEAIADELECPGREV
ncbi:Glutamine synthetase [Symbiodinium microadriaticum]|uniref:Glutamine synthetase n=1 Tax=Symbiodinium microadriaticum TaxID=2951 RepID=A0A1Q9DA03_SYMMI|nr:Glutamine synthetase [Symbiodinium microadriaticum]